MRELKKKNFSLFNEVKDRAMNLGLDLKGGINVILQISVKDIFISKKLGILRFIEKNNNHFGPELTIFKHFRSRPLIRT